MAAETKVAEIAIIDRLKAYVPLDTPVGDRIYNEVAPAGASKDAGGTPRLFILVRLRSAVDANGVGTFRGATNLVYVVEALKIGPSFADVADVADHIDDALQGYSAQSADGKVHKIRRVAPWKQLDDRLSPPTARQGGQYEVTVTSP